MNKDILSYYQTLANQYQSLSGTKKRQLKFISFARLVCFISIVPVYYYLSQISNILAVAVSFLFLALFLFLIKLFIHAEKQLLFYQRLSEINRNEISALNRDFSSFDPGSEFIDPHHDYSFDLDLYGTGSIFQFLNRTVTNRGKKFLSSLLNQTQRPADEIRIRQSAIQELAIELNWRQQFMAKGKEAEDQKTKTRIEESVRQIILLKSANFLKYLLLLLPSVTILLIGLSVTGIVTKHFYLLPVFSQWIIFIAYSKTISRFYKQFQSQSKLLRQYSEMLRQIERMSFRSDYLNMLKEKLTSKRKTASEITSELQKILNEFDYRQNLLVGFVLNSVFLWDVRCISKLYRWQQSFASDLPHWFDVIAEFDALTSLANVNYNYPEWKTPVVHDSRFLFKVENLGHPLIDEKKCVRNSFQIIGEEQIVIVTGANMAGKSTFLRTVGINLVLATNGCKVCADSFEFSPVRVYTNMRTSDNLMNDESYFYAELLRLQTMLNQIRKGENLFIIIDEMLKGTNSTDKLDGSKQLINQLISLNTHGIVATHDLALTELSQIHPKSIKNQCFEVRLQADELTFNYKLTNGVTRTMNATFLMKKMGIIPKD